MDELNVPENWTTSKLKNLPLLSRGQISNRGDVKNESCLVEMEDIEKDSGVIFFGREIPDKMSTKNVFKAGDILYGKLRPYLNKCGVAEADGICSSEIYVVDPVEMNSKFLAYYLRSPIFLNYASTQTHGARMPRLSRGLFQAASFPVPPKGEQERIVQKIETCFDRIEETESNLKEVETLLEKYRESLLAKAFRGELIPQNSKDEPASVLIEKIRKEREEQESGKKRKSKGFAPIKEDEKPFKIPESWEWVRLGELLNLSAGKGFKKNEYSEDGARLLQIANVTFGKTKWEEQNFLPESYIKTYPELELKEGDIVMALNRPILSGRLKIAEVESSDLPAILYQRVGRFDFYSKEICRRYIFEFCQSSFFVNYILDNLRGSDQPFINKGVFEDTMVPFPPFEEQVRVVNKIKSILETNKQQITQCLLKKNLLGNLKESILSKAFRGELVEQLESEGNAEELLAAIASKKHPRETSGKKVRQKKKTKKKKGK